MNRKDAEGDNVFQGGFLGLDNIGPFNRSVAAGAAGVLEQSDGTSWMAMYCQNLLEIALVLAEHDRTYEDLATKFFEHFALIASALNAGGLWDEQDGFYYDRLRLDGGATMPLPARSVVGLLPLVAVTTIGPRDDRPPARLPGADASGSCATDPRRSTSSQHIDSPAHAGWRMLSIVDQERLRRLLRPMLDPDEFLSDHGLRALSKWHQAHPLRLDLGGVETTLDYEPAESTNGLFGGNSNWRGPVWMPDQLPARRGAARLPPVPRRRRSRVEYPTGSGSRARPRRDRRRAHRAADLAVPARRAAGGGRSSATRRCCRTIRPGATCCCSTSTSTPTPAPASAPRTRPAGRASSPT